MEPAFKWKKRILLPIWIVRVGLLLVILVGFSAAISMSGSNVEDVIDFGYVALVPSSTVDLDHAGYEATQIDYAVTDYTDVLTAVLTYIC